MLYCLANGQELLSALGVTLNSWRVFKINGVVVGPGVINNSITFGRSFGVSQMFFFSGVTVKALPVSPI